MADNSTATRLLTLLNVSAIKKGKRKRTFEDKFASPAAKSGKRQTAFAEDVEMPTEPIAEATLPEVEETEDVEPADTSDPYERHFGPSPEILTESSRDSVDRKAYTTSKEKHGRLGSAVHTVPEGSKPAVTAKGDAILERLKTPFVGRQSKQPREHTELQNDLLHTLSSNSDLYMTSTSFDTQKSVREAVCLHALNHVTKKRRRVLKNNERLSNAAKATPPQPPPIDVQDQGYTRPSVLIILPFRSSALAWVNALTSHTPSPQFQVENQARFKLEYGLPPGAVDKLATAEPGTYPRDHVETFKGNVDDSFRVGIKVTRKNIKLFSEFYGCDIIIASPLGLRMSIEKENADFLSSIEVLIVDQMDALTMQNWEHTQFVFSNLNHVPKETRNTDFSRVKPWYLNTHAAYLRQTVLMSAYETPETRALFNTGLKNVAGRIRTEKRWAPIDVPEGVSQDFIHFDCVNPVEEADKRFHHFTTQLMPSIFKSAVQSSNTVIFVPSSFDFIRVNSWFKKHSGVTFSVLSEYSTNQDISRARQGFFKGQKSFLLISERFHFYRRYKIRGIRNVVFYGPPDHPQFYQEMASYPFLDEGVDASDVTCKLMFSKFDWFRLERIAGTDGALGLIKGT